MKEIARLARPDIYAMKPYSSARTEGKQEASVYLDANENPYPPYPGTDHEVGLNRYPEPQPHQLLDRFSELFDSPRERLFISRGADEAIDLLVRAFCTAERDGIVITPPTFVMYETAAEIQGAKVFRVPLTEDSFQLATQEMLDVCHDNPHIKLVFVCSPNNPTGNLVRRSDVLRLAAELFGTALVVVDELYVDYSGEASLSTEIGQHPNLVVLRSVSKEYSLAGERCGVTIAHPEVIAILGRIMAPYSISVSVVRAVSAALTPEGYAYGKANIQRVLHERARVQDALAALPSVIRIFPSDANYLFLQTVDAGLLVHLMEENGIKIRNRSNVLDQAVRISIGTPEENDQMLAVFKMYTDSVQT
jgi:histidinol-phosphate aminotransferase